MRGIAVTELHDGDRFAVVHLRNSKKSNVTDSFVADAADGVRE